MAKKAKKTKTKRKVGRPRKDKPIKITKDVVKSLLKVVNKGLVAGIGLPEPGKMCVEAAVSFSMGEDHNDSPKCVHPTLTHEKIELNDGGDWDDNDARADGLRRAAVAQLGSAGKFKSVKYEKLLNDRYHNYLGRMVWSKIERYRKENNVAGLLDFVSQWDAADVPADISSVSEYLNVLENNVYPEDWTGNDKVAFVAEELVQVLIQMKIPGTKFLNLTKEPKFF